MCNCSGHAKPMVQIILNGQFKVNGTAMGGALCMHAFLYRLFGISKILTIVQKLFHA